MRWKTLPVPGSYSDPEGYLKAVRLNSLGSLFFFAREVLGNIRLTTLHRHLCRSLETENLSLVMEVPMSHYKTTLGIALSIWWALPFTEQDDAWMQEYGYKKSWIRWMPAAHNQNTRTLVTHEIAMQASNIGKSVDDTYEHNDLFREVFKEILPDGDCVWTNQQKFHMRDPGRESDAGTGTYVYRGVGQALQGIHGNSIIQDDNFGKEAQDSMRYGDGRVRDDLLRWHNQLATRFDPIVKKSRRRLVISNRWMRRGDLNSHIQEKEPEFKFESHSAEGGCCKLHPANTPILPEQWSMELLAKERSRLGKLDYNCFYLNCIGIEDDDRKFDSKWLNYFTFKQSDPKLNIDDRRNVLLIEHAVRDGDAIPDITPGSLEMRIIVDANHAKKTKRKKHVIWCIGYDYESGRIYLLSCWAEDENYSVLIDRMYHEYRRWTVHNSITGFRPTPVYMGKSIRKILEFYLRERERMELKDRKLPLVVEEFEDDDSLAGMKNRIEALEPTCKEKQLWVHASHKDFLTAYENYPAGEIDTLDVLGYLPKVLVGVTGTDKDNSFEKQRAAFANRNG